MHCHMGTKGGVLGGGSYVSAGEVEFALAIIDLDAPAPEAELLSLGFPAHGLTIDPLDATRAARALSSWPASSSRQTPPPRVGCTNNYRTLCPLG